jgi:hypothetical protein
VSILTTLEHEVGRRPPYDTDLAHCQRIFGDKPSASSERVVCDEL